jgi:hypothetical protein
MISFSGKDRGMLIATSLYLTVARVKQRFPNGRLDLRVRFRPLVGTREYAYTYSGEKTVWRAPPLRENFVGGDEVARMRAVTDEEIGTPSSNGAQ